MRPFLWEWNVQRYCSARMQAKYWTARQQTAFQDFQCFLLVQCNSETRNQSTLSTGSLENEDEWSKPWVWWQRGVGESQNKRSVSDNRRNRVLVQLLPVNWKSILSFEQEQVRGEAPMWSVREMGHKRSRWQTDAQKRLSLKSQKARISFAWIFSAVFSSPFPSKKKTSQVLAPNINTFFQGRCTWSGHPRTDRARHKLLRFFAGKLFSERWNKGGKWLTFSAGSGVCCGGGGAVAVVLWCTAGNQVCVKDPRLVLHASSSLSCLYMIKETNTQHSNINPL